MLQSIENRTLGLNFTSAATVNALAWAPYAASVSLFVDGKTIPLEKKENGYWEKEISGLIPGTPYKFVIDDRQFPDPASLSQPEGVHGSSALININNFPWSDNQWKGIEPEDLIVYELHTGTFSPAGTFDGIRDKIDYFKDLGITAVEIMPVSQFPGSRNWGYDGVFPFAVQYSYGGAEKLQKLVDAFHNENIAVILDVVYNHLGPEGNYLSAFGPYFTDKYHTPWGSAVNFDDQWCDGVRRFVIENALMWFRDFHIDGLRLDAVHAIRDFGAKHILEELKENTEQLSKVTGRKHLLIAETDLNDVRYINPIEKGGYGIDIQWCDEFHHSVHSLITSEKTGYYSDFGTIGMLCKSLNSAYVYDGIYSPSRKRTFGNKTTGLPGSSFLVFLQNHDQTGNRLHGDRLSAMVDSEALKLIAGTLFFSPFIPLIFMGEEYGEKNPFLYFVEHSDPGLIKAVREGRKREFSYLDEHESFPDPQSEETFNQSKLSWDIQSEQQAELLEFYKELIRLRKKHPVVRNTDRNGTEADVVKDRNTILLLRQNNENITICIMNFEDKPVTLELARQKKPLFVLLNSSGKDWNKIQNVSLEKKANEITINAKSVILLSDLKG
jgi:maltooligosyltrehalose trehalohydrolase